MKVESAEYDCCIMGAVSGGGVGVIDAAVTY